MFLRTGLAERQAKNSLDAALKNSLNSLKFRWTWQISSGNTSLAWPLGNTLKILMLFTSESLNMIIVAEQHIVITGLD